MLTSPSKGLKQLGLSSFPYLGFQISVRLLAFLSLPLFTQHFTPEEYGTIALFELVSSFMAVFLALGIHGAFSQKFYSTNIDPKKTAKLYASLYWPVQTIALFVFLPLFFFSTHASTFLFNNDEANLLMAVKWGLASGFFQAGLQLPIEYFRIRHKHLHSSFLLNAPPFLGLLTTISFLYLFDWGVLSYFWGFSFSFAFFYFASVLFSAFKANPFRTGISWDAFKDGFLYSFPIVIHACAHWVIYLSDRYILEHLRGLYELGIYSLGYNLGFVVFNFAEALNRVIVPRYFQEAERGKDGKRWYAQTTNIFLLAVAFSATTLTLIGTPLLKYFIAKDYLDALKILPWVSASYVLFAVYFSAVNPIYFHRKTKLLAFSTPSCAVLNVLLNLFLVPRYGALGAAIATFLSILALSLIMTALSHRHTRYPFSYPTWGKVVFLAVFFIFLGNTLQLYNHPVEAVLLWTGYVLFVFLLFRRLFRSI